jgi:hypothetical protein
MRKTQKKINRSLFDKCKTALGVKKYSVIIVLLELWQDGNLIITDTEAIEGGDYKYTDIYLDNLIFNSLSISIEQSTGEPMKDFELLDILMLNYLN